MKSIPELLNDTWGMVMKDPTLKLLHGYTLEDARPVYYGLIVNPVNMELAGVKLKDLITGKSHDGLVERLETDDPGKVWEFITKYKYLANATNESSNNL